MLEGHAFYSEDMGLPPWVPQAETKPAPPPLLLVQSFVNTYDAATGTDLLANPRSAVRWLHSCGLLHQSRDLEAAQLQQIRDLREAIRALLQANAGNPGPTRAQHHLLSSIAGRATLQFTIDPATQRLRIEPDPGNPIDTIAAQLLLIIRDAQLDGTWPRFKACSNTECVWAYYDRSHAHNGKWCDMSGCGNRLKNRALRARHR